MVIDALSQKKNYGNLHLLNIQPVTETKLQRLEIELIVGDLEGYFSSLRNQTDFD